MMLVLASVVFGGCRLNFGELAAKDFESVVLPNLVDSHSTSTVDKDSGK